MLGELWIDGNTLKIDTATGVKTMTAVGFQSIDSNNPDYAEGTLFISVPSGNHRINWVTGGKLYWAPVNRFGTTSEPNGSLWINNAVLQFAFNGVAYSVER